jgi:hypothetical protein
MYGVRMIVEGWICVDCRERFLEPARRHLWPVCPECGSGDVRDLDEWEFDEGKGDELRLRRKERGR